MKRIKLSLKWKVFLCFAVFTAVIICLLWLFQTVFLEDFYKMIKTNSIHSSATTLMKNIEQDDLETIISNIAESNDICIRVVDQNGTDISSAEMARDCTIHKLGARQLSMYYLSALENNGEYLERRVKTTPDIRFFNEFGWNNTGLDADRAHKEMESIIYVKLTQRDNQEVMIMLNAVISPVDATVRTLRIQLIWISVILILLALILSLIVAKIISRPIEKINDSAKLLAEGKYDITFPNNGYREVAELGDTLNYAATELSKTEELRRELIANVSHDLRTPLTMITGYGEVMRDLPGENTPENVQIIIDEAKRLTDLVNDMLDISKLQSGTQTLNLERFSLTETIQETMTRYHKLTEHDGYQIAFLYQENVYVVADRLRISQVIYNLINNAIAYTGEDKKIVVSQTIYDDKVRISVTDTGEGIEQDMLPLIWDRYYKVDKTHKRAAVGTGLGLSIVKSTVELHGGTCGVTSQKGVGSTFWFELKRIEHIDE